MVTSNRLFATAAKGTEGALRDELIYLGMTKVRASRGGVSFEGPLEAGVKACLWSRVASRVLLCLGEARVDDADELYAAARAVEWEHHLDHRGTFAVRATTRSTAISHSGFAALKIKDAIVDRLRDEKGSRPNVDTRRPDVQVFAHIEPGGASFYLDMSGQPLHRRGWRARGGTAPLKESLAAAILLLGGHDPNAPFCDPMCGSGTFLIEAAMRARRMAPGLQRGFGFESWPAFGLNARARWRELREEAKELVLSQASAAIIGGDRSDDAVELARANALAAGVGPDVTIEQADARALGSLPAGCQVFINPPYGERLGKRRLQLEGMYRGLGETLMSIPRRGKIVVLAGNRAIERLMGAAPSRRHELYNGPLRCVLLEFDP